MARTTESEQKQSKLLPKKNSVRPAGRTLHPIIVFQSPDLGTLTQRRQVPGAL
jgi:hypothetical protein